ncbi:hypothetical protein BDN72DRAFT_411601 [Pluteus cervinus]|uniref:Uncharacterized protein n=1 Tax=Pluteus cervinus TaxID=181527 RepID=A0ACD3A8X1_9AGAR|nr:hypothetical protein BDN72DRAFT_411601 [Pluteus cervinus]
MSGSDREDGDKGDHGGGGDDDDDASYIEISVDEHSRAQLHAAVASVSEARLRHILTRLIGTNPAVEEALLRELITVERNTKKVIPRFETCENCDEEFEVDDVNQKDECVFHPGELECNERAFVDWDEDVHGEMDVPENRRQFPENFLWTCCERDGKSEGCVRSDHKPGQSQSRKRRRI